MERLQEYVDLPEAFYRESREHCASTLCYMIKGSENPIREIDDNKVDDKLKS